jgi:hypothetical protein
VASSPGVINLDVIDEGAPGEKGDPDGNPAVLQPSKPQESIKAGV